MGDALKGTLKDLTDRRRRLRGADDAWATATPPALRDRATLVRLDRGTLMIAPADSAAAFEIDRWLRAGGLEQLRALSGGSIRRVRTGAQTAPEEPRRNRFRH